MADAVLNCHRCGGQVKLTEGLKIYRTDTCEKCGADLHCCRNCRFFDPGKNNQCAEPQAEWVSDKERANFCEYFDPRGSVDLVRRSGAGAGDARKAFDALFKK